MTIDEAIKQIEEIVEDNQRIVDTHRFFDELNLTIEEIYCDDAEIIEECLAVSQKRVYDFRQLAEWLKELKQLREQTQESEAEQFARWVATKIFSGMFEEDTVTFAELACRKLAKLGIIKADGDEWTLVKQQESEGTT